MLLAFMYYINVPKQLLKMQQRTKTAAKNLYLTLKNNIASLTATDILINISSM